MADQRQFAAVQHFDAQVGEPYRRMRPLAAINDGLVGRLLYRCNATKKLSSVGTRKKLGMGGACVILLDYMQLFL